MLEISLASLLLIVSVDMAVAVSPQFLLYTSANINRAVDITNRVGQINVPNINSVKFLVHGFTDSGNAAWIQDMKNRFIQQRNVPVVIVNWQRDASGPNYYQAAHNTIAVGQRIAGLIKNIGLDPLTDVHCIGHSLGSHVCGFCGKVKTLKRITALDPAGPCFYYNSLNNPLPLPPLYCGTSGAITGDVGCTKRLCKTDATHVDVIHTSKAFGIVPAIGHADYYPNGGVSQPGCRDIDLVIHPGNWVACSHNRAHQLFTESIGNRNAFTAYNSKKYSSWVSYQTAYLLGWVPRNSADNGHMGAYSNDYNDDGYYYLYTNAQAPYSRM